MKLAARSLDYFEKAMALVKSLSNASLVTLPVSKEWILKSKDTFFGHTEELEKFFQVKTSMCMYHPELSIVPMTNHIPLKKVPSAIEKYNSESLYQSLCFFRDLFRPARPFAMTGLNPHAGEGGRVGREEASLVKIVQIFRKKGINISGPASADGIFMPSNRKKYSLVVATYHDQALIPFKALFGTSGLNITLNLPVLRVSPDHGPAYEIAGKNGADIQSVIQSLTFAMRYGEKWIKQYYSR